ILNEKLQAPSSRETSSSKHQIAPDAFTTHEVALWNLMFGASLELGVWSLHTMTVPFDPREFQLSINRRTFLGRAAYGLGGIALACLFDPKLIGSASAAATPEGVRGWKGIVDPPHFPVRAKRI